MSAIVSVAPNASTKFLESDAFELRKSQGIQRRESLLRKKADDAVKREAKEQKKARKAAQKEKHLRKEVKKPCSIEEFMPPRMTVVDDAYASCTRYLNERAAVLANAAAKVSDAAELSSEHDSDEDDCILVQALERGYDMESPEEGWALL
jgi:hypothetical protein